MDNSNLEIDNSQKKINIGIFCDSFFPMIDGVVNVMDNYAKRLIKYANVTVFAPQGRDKNFKDDFPYKVVRCTKKFKCPGLDYDLPLPEMDSDFMDAIEQSNLDIVHIHSPFSIGKVALNYAKQHKIPCVATCHSQFKKDFYEATKSNLLTGIMMNNIMPTFEKCEECWAVNKQVAKLYHDEYKLKIMPKVKNNGTEMKYYDNKQKVDELRKSLNIADDEKILLFVGRLHILKNIFFILDSLEYLKQKNFKFKMIFVGTGPDEKEFKAKIHEKNLDKDIILTGRISDRETLAKYFNMADLFLFPSLYDCSSLVQIEAASQKTPSLFLYGAVTSGTCTENVDAYFSENDPEKYADKIIDIFANTDEYNQICQGAFDNLYVSWDEAVDRIYNDYLDVIKKYKEGYYTKLKKYIKLKIPVKKKVVKKRKNQEQKDKKLLAQQERKSKANQKKQLAELVKKEKRAKLTKQKTEKTLERKTKIGEQKQRKIKEKLIKSTKLQNKKHESNL